jgi:outer membrane protein assembly factor BamE (lipoprotein component of BamABCDE complex)
MKKLAIVILLALSLTSCLTRVEKKGYMFDLSDANLLQEKVTSKDETLRYMGYPTLTSYINEEVWIYMAEDKKHLLFFKPKTVSREVLVIKFDDKNTIKTLQRLSLKDGDNKLHFSPKYTEVMDNDESFFKSLFGNIGQVKASQ